MVKLMGIEISSSELYKRIIIGSILSAITLILLFICPTLISSLSGPVFIIKSVDLLIDQILNPFIPIIGVIVSILVLISFLLRNSRLEGPLFIALGLSTLLYFYVLLNGGVSWINIPDTLLDLTQVTDIPMKVNVVISINSVPILILSAITSIMITGKGIIITYKGRKK